MTTEDRPTVSLANLARGAALEKFDDELKQALANILDPNTVATDAREITLRVKIKPDESRQTASVDVSCGTRLAAPRSVTTRIFIGRRGAQVVGIEDNPLQTDLFQPTKPEPLRSVEGGKK